MSVGQPNFRWADKSFMPHLRWINFFSASVWLFSLHTTENFYRSLWKMKLFEHLSLSLKKKLWPLKVPPKTGPNSLGSSAASSGFPPGSWQLSPPSGAATTAATCSSRDVDDVVSANDEGDTKMSKTTLSHPLSTILILPYRNGDNHQYTQMMYLST